MEHTACRHEGKDKKNAALRVAVLIGGKQRQDGHCRHQAQQRARIKRDKSSRMSQLQQEEHRHEQVGHRPDITEHLVQCQHDASRRQQTQHIDRCRQRPGLDEHLPKREKDARSLDGGGSHTHRQSHSSHYHERYRTQYHEGPSVKVLVDMLAGRHSVLLPSA